jgi:nucleosome assembly protein 1-like 1
MVHSGRLAGLVGRSSGYVENLPAQVKRRVEGLKGVQAKYTELEAQMKREMLELEKKVRKDSSVCLYLQRLI